VTYSKRFRLLPFAATLIFACAAAFAQTQAVTQPPGVRALREVFDFLLGSWEGEGSGEPGQGTGSFVFEASLDGNLISRRSHSEYPASKDRPAVSHQDFMAVYAEGGQVRADYFDNEGHVIHYTASYAHESATVTFLSPIIEGRPRYRLTYRPLSKDRVEVAFEIAPPDKATAFTMYVKGISRRLE
jgi:hypothetical protein